MSKLSEIFKNILPKSQSRVVTKEFNDLEDKVNSAISEDKVKELINEALIEYTNNAELQCTITDSELEGTLEDICNSLDITEEQGIKLFNGDYLHIKAGTTRYNQCYYTSNDEDDSIWYMTIALIPDPENTFYGSLVSLNVLALRYSKSGNTYYLNYFEY